jgi:quinol monooxygenase YgiN
MLPNKEAIMVHTFVRFTVEDYAKWRAIFDSLSSLRDKMGSHGGQIFRGADNPNEITVVIMWDNPGKAQSFFQSDELRRAMQQAGVQGPPDITFWESVDNVSA